MAAPSSGDILECRAARLYSRQGYFVRRRVDIGRWFEEKVQVTDIDVYVFDFDVDLALRRTVGECKSGTGKSAPKTVELILSLSGLRGLTDAQGAVLFTSKRATPRVRQLGLELGVVIQDEEDLDRRENGLGIDKDPYWGSHHPELVTAETLVHKTTRTDRDLERAYWFFRSNFWQLDEFTAVKRALNAIELLSKRWVSGLKEDDDRAIGWLISDAVTAFSVASLMLARPAILWPEQDFRNRLLYGLAGGVASVEEMQRLSQAIDRYMYSIFEKAGIPKPGILSALGAFEPRPPKYAESLTELIVRLALDPAAARDLPKVIDAVLAYRFKQRQSGLPDLTKLRVYNPQATLALARQASAFLSGHVGLPDLVGAAFSSDQPNATQREAPVAQGAELPLDPGEDAKDRN